MVQATTISARGELFPHRGWPASPRRSEYRQGWAPRVSTGAPLAGPVEWQCGARLARQARLLPIRAPGPPGGRTRDLPFVELRDGDGNQRLVTLSGERLTVGRSPASGLALVWDAQVSRSHASIDSIDGVWTVLDDGRSTNGTFVNEERVNGRRTLRHLDVIRVGATRVRFHDPSEAGQDSKLTEVAGSVAIPTLTPAQLRVSERAVPPGGRPGLE